MAENVETTIIDVKLDAGRVAADLDNISREIERVKKAQQGLDDEFKKGEISMADYTKYSVKLKDELSWLQKQQKGLSATTKLLTADNATYSDSLNGMRQKLADMQKAYAQLDKVERESEGGKAFLDAIAKQSDAVKELEAAMGDHRRNVGNYPKTITAIVPALGGVTAKMDAMQQAIMDAGQMTPKAMSAMANGFKQATVQALKFIATPVGAILAGIVATIKTVSAVLGKLREAIAKNDEAGTNFARLFASFQPILTFVNKAFDGLASILGKVAGKIADIVSMFSDASSEAQQLVTDIDDLEETERQYVVNGAQRNRDIARMRAEAAESTDLETRKRLLSEAIELERKNLEDEKAIAKQRLDNLVRTAAQEVDTSDATNNKIAEARAAMYQAEQKYYTETRRLSKELSSIGVAEAKERAAAAKAAADERARAAKEASEAEKAAAKEAAALAKQQAEDEAEIRRQAEDFTVSLIEDEAERRIAQRRLQGERELEDMQKRLESDATLTEKARTQLAQLILDKEQQMHVDLAEMREEAAKAEVERDKQRQMFIAQQRLETVEQMRQETDEEQAVYEQARWEAQKEVWRQQMDDELAQVDLTNDERVALQRKWDAVLEAAEQAHQAKLTDIQKKANETRNANNRAAMQAAAGFMGALSDILADYGEQNKAAAVASKALALGKIGIETGVALAGGIAQAQSVPFPANLAAIATTITTVLANVGTAINMVKSVKFSHGGIVGGGSYGQGDTVHAMLSPQEVVLNPTQTAQTLFAIANGAQVGSSAKDMADVVVAAVAAQPAPVLQYSEFESFNQKRITYNEIAKI